MLKRMDIPPILPPLPPKSKHQLPAFPPTPPSRTIESDSQVNPPSCDRLSSSVPSNSPFSPASFLNPLYFHTNVPEKAKTQRSASVGEASLHFIGPSKAISNPVVKFSDSDCDSDSVYSLESVSSQSVKSERYVEGPIVKMKQDAPEHVYELCEIDRPKVKDIFDLVSFKSPLYGTIRTKETYSQPDSETYDVPLKSNPVDIVSPKGIEAINKNSFEKCGDAVLSNFEVQNEVYDIPVKSLNTEFILNEGVLLEVSPEEDAVETTTSCSSELDIDSVSCHSFDFEILCDVDGMLPPPYPPPPPPINFQDVVAVPKIPPRLIPPPIPKRPSHTVLPKCEPKILNTDFNVEAITQINDDKCILEDNINMLSTQNVLKFQQESINEASVSIPKSIDLSNLDLLVPAPVSHNSLPRHQKKGNPLTYVKSFTRPDMSLSKSVCVLEAATKPGADYGSLPRFKKLTRTLSALSSRVSSTSVTNSANRSLVETIERSVIEEEHSSRIGVLMCGYLFKIGSNGKDLSKKWYSLENGYLCWYSDHKADCPQSKITKRSIVGVSNILQNSNGGDASSDLWCFRVFTVNSRHLLLGGILPSECNDWVRHLALAIAPPGLISGQDTSGELHCVGQVYIKEGVSGRWQKGCLSLCGRWLHLWLEDTGMFRRINLQTVSAIATESSLLQCISAVERGPVFHLNLPQGVLYLQGDWPIYTETLLSVLKKEWALPQRARLADHYVTIEGLPIIVDRCLKFVSTHGTTLEGIYRLSGSSSKIRQLLEHFLHDVWGAHLKLDEYSPHDVASVLKRFLRSLPECLLTEKLYSMWVECSGIVDQEKRLFHMKDLLSHLPEINYNTLKKLIGHLCMIAEHSSQNLMPAMNLAPVFGPTLLFRVSGEIEGLKLTSSATDTVADLIRYYSLLFEVENQEIEKERRIQLAVQKMKDARISQKPAGDILVGVYVYSKDWGKCINIRLTPTTSARDVCEYAVSAGNIREPLSKVALMEVACDENLERPLHFSEFVLVSTLRWMNSQDEAKNNYLCIKHNSIYDAVLPIIAVSQGQAMSVFGELNYADTSNKSFKKLQFEFTGAKLRCFKTVKAIKQVVGEWNIEDIVWYLGAETKRPPSTKWSFTFIDRNTPVKRTKSNPYFGHTVCCRSEEELHKWVAAMLIGEYPQGLLPAISLPDLLI